MPKKKQAKISGQEQIVRAAQQTLKGVRKVQSNWPRERGDQFVNYSDEVGGQRVDPGSHLKKKSKGWPNYPGNDWGAYTGYGERPAVYWD